MPVISHSDMTGYIKIITWKKYFSFLQFYYKVIWLILTEMEVIKYADAKRGHDFVCR